jgi:hypothetical protein
MADLGPWPLRVLWAMLPLTSGAAFGASLDTTATPFRTTCTLALWAIWAVTLMASLVPRPSTLTVVRIVAPAAPLAAIWATAAGDVSTVSTIAALLSTLAAAAAALHPVTGDAFVDGSSYGNERRMALRPPGPLLLGPIELAWLAVVAGLAAGPLLLAAEQWVAGALALVVGAPVAGLSARALYGLARRWIVFVPNGLVLHDPMAVSDPVLLPRASMKRLGPAPADTGALDLTQGALGLALEIDLDDPVRLVQAKGGSAGEIEETTAILFTPSRPAALLTEAAKRRVPVR